MNFVVDKKPRIVCGQCGNTKAEAKVNAHAHQHSWVRYATTEAAGEAAMSASETWQLGPQDEVGRWVFRRDPDSPFAIHGIVGFHIGGVYGWVEEQERVLAILKADHNAAQQLFGVQYKLEEALRELGELNDKAVVEACIRDAIELLEGK